MTTDLDELMVQVQSTFTEQAEICHNFKELARKYRPIRMEAVATVVTLKDFADSSLTMLIPMLEVALDDGSVSETKEVLEELVDTYGSVNNKLSKLKDQHEVIAGAARICTDDMASREQQQKNEVSVASSKADNAAIGVGGGGVGTAVTAGVMILATGSGPVGWSCIAVAGILTAGAAAKMHSLHRASGVHEKLQLAIVDISAQMYKVTEELERQCKALQSIITKLEGACKSTASIQALVDSWGDEGQNKTKMGKLKYKLWLTKQLPHDMQELSDFCKVYLADETQRVPLSEQLALRGKVAVEVD